MKASYDYCILGAGLAGLSLAKSISERTHASILIIDPNGIAGGASGSPIGLVNPATGRYANQTWKAAESVKAIEKNLNDVARTTNKLFYKKSGVIRPALEEKIADRMQENLENSIWPKNWCKWLDRNQLNERFQGIGENHGGVWVEEGFTVSIPDYLTNLGKFLKQRGIEIIEHENYELTHNNESPWSITVSGIKKDILIDNLVITAGIKTLDFKLFEELPLIPVKGQVVVFSCEASFPYQAAVSALGYFASIDGQTFVAGSTYEHKFRHEMPDLYGLEYISKRLFKVMPFLDGKIKLENQWSGVRSSTPDRMPIVGNHPNKKNCFVFTGLGSKGLLYSGFLSNVIADHLTQNSKIPAEVSIDRFL
jgi:glycine/D-amino acid oxidase-like deaminating enzyme